MNRGIMRAVSVSEDERGHDVHVRVGTSAEYDAFAHWHYRMRPPATVVRVLVATLSMRGGGEGARAGEPVGVLVVSMPVLNGRWRDLAWPGRYRTRDKRGDAKRINSELRTISRVIVDPRARGLGIATSLVRAYLERPMTVATEAVAAMGSFCGFFAGAGMVEYQLAPTEAQVRFLDLLEAKRATAESILACGKLRRRLAARGDVQRELERLATGSGRARLMSDGGADERLAEACRRVSVPLRAYAYSVVLPTKIGQCE